MTFSDFYNSIEFLGDLRIDLRFGRQRCQFVIPAFPQQKRTAQRIEIVVKQRVQKFVSHLDV